MRNKKIIVAWLMLVAFALGFTSCQKATFLKVDNNEVHATLEGTSGDIKIETDVKSVEVIHSPQWVKTSINEENTILHYEVALNTDRKFREDSIVLECAGLSCTVHMIQTFKATYIKFDKDTVTISRSGGSAEVNVEVDASTPLTIDDHEIAKVEGRKILITVPKSNSKWGIHKVLKVSCDDISANLIIRQESSVCAKCDGEGFLNQTCPVCDGVGAHMCCSYTGKKRCPACGGSGIAK